MGGSREQIISRIEKDIVLLEKEQGLAAEEVLEIVKERLHDKKEPLLPLSIFSNDSLSPLETITTYLKEQRNYSYRTIAALLNRNEGPIAVTYRRAREKKKEQLNTSSSSFVPVSIFRSKTSVLESLVLYLKDDLSMNLTQIAHVLRRDHTTVWTVYRRGKNKT
ncbi:hypothetical protein J4460_05570 [Candidatus Woesearchaeota archaeon]|nr:MAG: hypothetical protein QS99_C0015G0029 [archaeon GW2011_AR4]MBS3130115.1 hypothetical protein [Candidatus Woesearchaeota archaeon]HIH38732.1 hypothetical protein [Candidatus Woesearchaeota archaeon]HIH49284.1 hypothetical protein [Candidatus Woesearchaeota archaeon]HIJ03626.1 hypothetical protein [Candidatus Woesearchaeota archaeon]